MTIRHHPHDELLAGFAGGRLDQGQQIAIATHLTSCAVCRRFVRAMEEVGGAMLERVPPSTLSPDAYRMIEVRLAGVPDAPLSRPAPIHQVGAFPGLPDFVQRLPARPWAWIAPRLHLKRIELPAGEPTRVFLLKAGAGTRLLPHTHTALEMTCVLTGNFSHDGQVYAPGDFDVGECDVEHEIVVGGDEECISLIAMQGELRLKGLLGRIVQPLISI